MNNKMEIINKLKRRREVQLDEDSKVESRSSQREPYIPSVLDGSVNLTSLTPNMTKSNRRYRGPMESDKENMIHELKRLDLLELEEAINSIVDEFIHINKCPHDETDMTYIKQIPNIGKSIMHAESKIKELQERVSLIEQQN